MPFRSPLTDSFPSWTRQDVLDADAFAREFLGPARRSRRFARGNAPPIGGRGFRTYDESVVGTDDRFQVHARSQLPSTSLFPFNTICLVQDPSAPNGSGVLIAPQVMLTAGHVLQGFGAQTITPGADLSATSASDQRPATPGSQVAPTSGFRFHPSLDLGLAILPRPFTAPTRFMMLQPRGDVNTATLLTIAGYPNVGPGSAPVGTMWAHSNKLRISNVSATHLTYPIDTTVGQSGSPLWLLGNDGIRLLLGIHTNGGGTANSGVRITCEVISWIERECTRASVTGPVVDNVARRATCA